MILTALHVEPHELHTGTGWDVKPEGACKGELCVPLPAAALDNGVVDVKVLAERLGMPLVHDEKHDLWSLGPASFTGRALTTAVAPELVLPDLDGNLFALSSLRGKKVVIAAWASW